MTIVLSTDGLRPNKREAFWRHVMSDTFAPVSIREMAEGDLRVRSVGTGSAGGCSPSKPGCAVTADARWIQLTESENAMNARATVVLVHGGFVDGSGWQAVYDLLTLDGYRVSVVQNPTLSLAGDVAATHRVIDAQNGPVVLVGHSYGGAVITEAGSTVVQAPGSHAIYLSQPGAVAALIREAATAVSTRQ